MCLRIFIHATSIEQSELASGTVMINYWGIIEEEDPASHGFDYLSSFVSANAFSQVLEKAAVKLLEDRPKQHQMRLLTIYK